MKALKCEMCGSNDVVKQDGFYVCQNCGTKYTVEEARKMMIEGTVEVQGTVTVDNKGSINNYLLMAKNAYDSGNQKEAESYCNRIIEIDPTHSEAWLIKGKSAGWQSTMANLRLDESISCFTKAIENANESERDHIKAEIREETENLSNAIIQLACNHFAEFPSEDNYEQITNMISLLMVSAFPLIDSCGGNSEDLLKDLFETVNNGACDAYNHKVLPDYNSDQHPSKYEWETFLNDGDNCIGLLRIITEMNKSDTASMIRYYKSMITMQEAILNSCSWTIGDGGNYVREYSLSDTAKEARINDIMTWHQKIKDLDPNYSIPERPSSKTGCYIATAVYGSYNCPQVWTLRRFRDNTLDATWYGRAFIKSYYAISPTLVRWFGETSWFKRLWRKPLDKLVASLRNIGVEDTPYTDKY